MESTRTRSTLNGVRSFLWGPTRIRENSTCEIAFLGGRELSLKDWQKARLTTLVKHAISSNFTGWNFSTSLCRECAAGIEKLYPETEEEALPSEDTAIIAQSADPAVMNSWENELVNQSPWRGQRDGDGEPPIFA